MASFCSLGLFVLPFGLTAWWLWTSGHSLLFLIPIWLVCALLCEHSFRLFEKVFRR